MNRITVVYLAGPYTGSSYMEIERHIRVAEEHAIALWTAGFGVFCPHLNSSHFEVKACVPERNYKEFDLWMLRSCDALLALPGHENSVGATAELLEATKLGIPVYLTLEELLAQETPVIDEGEHATALKMPLAE